MKKSSEDENLLNKDFSETNNLKNEKLKLQMLTFYLIELD